MLGHFTSGSSDLSLRGPDAIRRTGPIAQGLEDIESEYVAMMVEHLVPSAQVALMKDGKLFMNRAYGTLDKEGRVPLQPDALFRLASIEKPITGTALEIAYSLKLPLPVIGGTLEPHTKIMKALYDANIRPPAIHPDVMEITPDLLLHHKAGLNPLPSVEEVMAFLKLTSFPKPLDLVRWHMGQPPRFTPGSKEEYQTSNFDCLKAILEWVTGDYMKFTKSRVFSPAGTAGIGLTHCRPSNRDPKEVFYSTDLAGTSVFPEDKGKQISLTEGGGGVYHEAHLAVMASAEAITRYLDTWYMGRGTRLYRPGTRTLSPGLDNGTSLFFGACIGTQTMMIQNRYWGWCAAVLFNRAEERQGVTPPKLEEPIINRLKKEGWA